MLATESPRPVPQQPVPYLRPSPGAAGLNGAANDWVWCGLSRIQRGSPVSTARKTKQLALRRLSLLLLAAAVHQPHLFSCPPAVYRRRSTTTSPPTPTAALPRLVDSAQQPPRAAQCLISPLPFSPRQLRSATNSVAPISYDTPRSSRSAPRCFRTARRHWPVP